MMSTIEKDNKAFAQVAAELTSSGALDRWLGKSSVNQSFSSVHNPVLLSLLSSFTALNWNEQGYSSNQEKIDAFISEAISKGVPDQVAFDTADKYLNPAVID